MSRISLKIVSSIVSSIFLVAVCIGTISLVRASSIIKEETAQKFLHMSENYSNRFSSFLSGVEKTVHAFSVTVAAGFDSDNFRNDESYRNDFMSQINRSLLNIAEHNGSIQGIYCVINPEITGEVYESWFISSGGNSFVYQEPEDISTFYPENEDMKWYYDPIMNRSGIWSLPYTDATIDVKMVSYTHAIYADEQLIGVAGIDLFFSDMFRTVSEMVFYNSGYGILTDSAGNIIVHPELEDGSSLIGEGGDELEALTLSLETNTSDVVEYQFRGREKLMGYSRLSNGWIFMATADIEEIFNPLRSLKQIIILIVIVAILLGTAVGLSLSRSITGQLNILHDMTDRIGNGNFDLPAVQSTQDEIGRLAESFRTMSRKLAASQDELLELNKTMKVMAFHDPLTHLPNRRYAMNALDELLSGEKRDSAALCGIMSIDLDNLKDINDSRGHDAGDTILKHAADMMNHQISSHDRLCRIGGDEFILIFRDVPSMELVEAMAGRILRSVRGPVQTESGEISTGCSIGIAVIESGIHDVESLLKKADLALYEAKESGRNNYQFYRE